MQKRLEGGVKVEVEGAASAGLASTGVKSLEASGPASLAGLGEKLIMKVERFDQMEMR